MRRWPVLVYLSCVAFVYLVGAVAYWLPALKGQTAFFALPPQEQGLHIALCALTLGLVLGLIWRSVLAAACFLLAALGQAALYAHTGHVVPAWINGASVVLFALVFAAARRRSV